MNNTIERHKDIHLIQNIKIRQNNELNIVDKELKDMEYVNTHGFFDNNTLECVFSLVKLIKPITCVVIGTGCGLIPRIIREAQIECNMKDSKTFLVDLGYNMGAIPNLVHTKDSLFQTLYPEIIIYKNYSYPQGLEFIKKNVNNIDILWIDGDHSYEGSKNDFVYYNELMSEKGLIFMHDTSPSGKNNVQPSWCGVHKTIDFIKENYKDKYEVLNFTKIFDFNPGCGLAILKKT